MKLACACITREEGNTDCVFACTDVYRCACARVIRTDTVHIHTPADILSHIARAAPCRTYTSIRKHGYLSGGGLYACCRCKLAPGYRQRNRTRSHCMNIICIQVGYMAGAGISCLARINDYMDPTDVGGPATPRSPRLALYPFTPFYPSLPPPSCALRTLALSQNTLLMARAYNLWLAANAAPSASLCELLRAIRPPALNFAASHLIFQTDV